jgi:hypothetical protein
MNNGAANPPNIDDIAIPAMDGGVAGRNAAAIWTQTMNKMASARIPSMCDNRFLALVIEGIEIGKSVESVDFGVAAEVVEVVLLSSSIFDFSTAI